MASVDRRAENRINATLLPNPGPYLARIVNNVDPMKQGALEVELLRPIGNQKETGGQLFVVRYLSPFYGVTPLDVTGEDPNEFNDTQKSYGFWAVPPDVGVTVMVIFVDSDPGQGYWIGCVQDALMNHMIPGIASSDAFQTKTRGNNDIEWLEVEETKKRFGEEIKYLPVGEINRRIFQKGKATPNPDVEANLKPVHPLAERLIEQGLHLDIARGNTSSSARRESPSNVYGWSTPGPLDKRKGAKLGKIGKVNDKIDKFVSRMGGHCFIMDDGNDRFLRKTRPWEGPPEYADLEKGEEGLVDFPADEQIRIRTRKGAQILLHSSEDLIYITNSRGTAWMEFTSEGKILMYAEDGIEQTSGGDISHTARRDMNFDVGRDKKVKVAVNYTENTKGTKTASAEGSMFLHAANDMGTRAGRDMFQHADFNHETKAQQVNMSGTSYEWAVGGSLLIDCSGNNFEVRASNVAITGTNDFHLHADNDMRVSGSSLDLKAHGGDMKLFSAAATVMKAGGTMGLESAGTASINVSGGQLNFTAKNSVSMASSGDAVKMSGKGGKMAITGDAIVLKSGGDLHLNGPDAPATDNADDGLDVAKEALPAQPATGAAGAATAGAGREFAIDLANFTYPNDQGGGLSKTAVGPQPSVRENENPARWHQANTDGNNPVVHTEKASYNVRGPSDFDKVPGDVGGGDNMSGDGLIFLASLRGRGRGTPANASKSRTNSPLTRDGMAAFPNDWRKDSEFLSKAQKLASKYGLEKEEMLAIFAMESKRTMFPNEPSPGGSRVGLIQMGDDQAKAAGTTVAKLKHMSRADQLDYVEKYFDKHSKGQVRNMAELYLLVMAPNKKVKSLDDEIYPRGSKAWSKNSRWRDKRTGKLTLKSVDVELQKEKEYVTSALGSGQNQNAQNSGQGPISSNPTTSPRVANTSQSNFGTNPSSSGTNVPYIRRDGSSSGNTL